MPRPLPLLLRLIEQEGREKRVDMLAALSGLKRYQTAKRAQDDRTRAVHSRQGPVSLLRSRNWQPGRETVLMIPSIINGPDILDLADDCSLLDALADTHNVMLVDWGDVGPGRADETFETLILEYLLPLISALDTPPHVLGYCLGGLFAVAMTHFTQVRSVALIATPWDFSAYPEHQRRCLSLLWQAQKPACAGFGLLPFELLQTGFWMLEPDRVASKYARVAQMGEDRFTQFVRVEDWANMGQPLMLAAARNLIEDLMDANATGNRTWRIGGRTIGSVARGVPCLSVRSTNDKIVPQAVSADFGTVVDLASGHVGMMVGSRRKSVLWQRLTDWFAADHSTQ